MALRHADASTPATKIAFECSKKKIVGLDVTELHQLHQLCAGKSQRKQLMVDLGPDK